MRFAFVFLIICVPMLVEAARARANERRQLERGGVEPPGDVYAVMRLAYPLSFLAMILEDVLRGGPPSRALVAGVVVFAVAKALKWWAILTLGDSWTFRVIVVSGTPLARGGPYRFVRHPNYVAVVGELIGVGLQTGAWVAAPIATVGFGLLILKRIRVEDRALVAARPS